jgi:hypothetical protein
MSYSFDFDLVYYKSVFWQLLVFISNMSLCFSFLMISISAGCLDLVRILWNFNKWMNVYQINILLKRTHIFHCPVQACYRDLGSEHCWPMLDQKMISWAMDHAKTLCPQLMKSLEGGHCFSVPASDPKLSRISRRRLSTLATAPRRFSVSLLKKRNHSFKYKILYLHNQWQTWSLSHAMWKYNCMTWQYWKP